MQVFFSSKKRVPMLYKSRCPVPTCKSARRKAKLLRPLPTKFQDLPVDVKDRILSEMR